MRRAVVLIFGAALVALLMWRLEQTGPLVALEERALDWRYLFRGPRGPISPDIVLVLVEEEANLDYRSPIPRRHLARVIEHLGPARLVGLDLLLDQLSFDREGDALLRQALADQGRVVAVSYVEGGREHYPHPYFREALLDVGYATMATSTGEEVVRRGTVVWDTQDGRALSLPGSLYARYRGLRPSDLRDGAIRQGPDGRDIATTFLIDYSGPPNAVYRRAAEPMPGGFVVCPSHLVAAGVYPSDVFADKVVLVGTGLSDAPDRFRTPFFASRYGFEKMLGVEVHAHFLSTLLGDAFLDEWGHGRSALLVFALAAVVGAGVLYLGVLHSLGLGGLCLAGLWVAAFALFDRQGLVLPLISPTLGLLASYGGMTSYHALTEGREKRQVRRMFEKYLSPEVISELLVNPQNWGLGGRTMEITVMFADLEGFTPLCENLRPDEVVRIINRFLTEVSRLIWIEGGTIDKYEGDLIMAFFGAPVPQDDHAARACRAALNMQARMEELRARQRERGEPELRLRIGLHSGPAVVGNMGSDFRFNYTAMGDTVNLASRLEQANKETHTYVMVSEQTRCQAGNAGLAYRDLGRIQVKGKSEPVQVYELLPGDDTRPAPGEPN